MTQHNGVSRRSFLGAGLAAAAAAAANVAQAAPRATEVDSWDEEFDMIVVGSGFAGLSACYEAQRLGLKKIVVLEKMEAFGGNSALCGGLTAREKNCILAHMWPLSRRAPRSREAAAVCLADKLCATAEIMQIWRNLGLRRAVLSGA